MFTFMFISIGTDIALSPCLVLNEDGYIAAREEMNSMRHCAASKDLQAKGCYKDVHIQG